MAISNDQLVGMLTNVITESDPTERVRSQAVAWLIKDDEPVMWFHPDDHSREQVALAMMMASKGLEADALVFVADSYVALQPVKHNGENWARGELEMQWITDGPDRDLIGEAVNATMVDRIGNAVGVSIIYEIKSGEFILHEPKVFEDGVDGAISAGYFPEKMKTIMAMPYLHQEMEAHGIALDLFGTAEERWPMQLAATAKLLMACGFTVNLGIHDEPRLVRAMQDMVEEIDREGVDKSIVPEMFKRAHDVEFEWPDRWNHPQSWLDS